MKTVAAILFFLTAFSAGIFGQKSPLPGGNPDNKTIVQVYPNPAVNFITFEFKKPITPGTSIQVYSFLGRQVAAIPVNSQKVTVNVTEYFRGIYVFQLRAPSGKILETNKFQVSR